MMKTIDSPPTMRISVLIPAILFFVWAIVSFWLFFSKQYLAYLQPKFGFLVLFSGTTFMLFAINQLLGKRNSSHHQVGILMPGLILLLPIFFLFSSLNTSLGARAFANRMIDSNADQELKSDEIINNPIQIEQSQSQPLINQQNASYYYTTITLSKLTEMANQYINHPVQIIGKIYIRDDIFWAEAAVYRFYITCCAADAQPVGVFLKDIGGRKFENDTWIEVKGIYHFAKIGGKYKPFLTPHSIEVIAEPSLDRQYLYFPD